MKGDTFAWLALGIAFAIYLLCKIVGWALAWAVDDQGE
jgi:hypothetical protein